MQPEADIDVRPVAVDKLTSFDDEGLASRLARVDSLIQEYTTAVAQLETQLDRSKNLLRFLTEEREKVLLAQSLKKGDVVRVVCPTCKGSGMKPTDVTSGRISTGSAFEGIKGGVTKSPTDDPRLRCPTCDGKKWVIMERYRG